MIAALFVARGGVYFGLDHVDPWDVRRNAKKYSGPWPVVAHPPCARWCRLAGLVEARQAANAQLRLDHDMLTVKRGADGGCFAAALQHVRSFGGVLEHPEASAAWPFFGLHKPPFRGGWIQADAVGGMTCRVEQGHYGHRARKGTWLYACGVANLPELIWGRSRATARISDARRTDRTVELLGTKDRLATPIPFRDLLLSIARSAHGTPQSIG